MHCSTLGTSHFLQWAGFLGRNGNFTLSFPPETHRSELRVATTETESTWAGLYSWDALVWTPSSIRPSGLLQIGQKVRQKRDPLFGECPEINGAVYLGNTQGYWNLMKGNFEVRSLCSHQRGLPRIRGPRVCAADIHWWGDHFLPKPVYRTKWEGRSPTLAFCP